MRIAIVGGGIAGLVATHLLHRKHQIVLFEAADHIGGHTNTIDVELDTGSWRIDTGFIVYNERNYPNFTRLLDQLGVATQPSTMSFSVRCDRTGLEYNGSSVDKLFAQRRNLLRPAFHRMLLDVFRFNRAAPRKVGNGTPDTTLQDFLERGGYSRTFIDHYVIPMGAAIWSQPRRQVLQMPAAFFVRFFENHGMLQIGNRPEWRVIRNGSTRYIEALTRPFRDRIHLRHAVRHVIRQADGVSVDGERFDEVVLACHSDQALRLLGDPTRLELEILGALPYQPNDVILHFDESVLPRRRKAWAAWNYHLRGSEEDPIAITYNMNMLQSLTGPHTFCVTLNGSEQVDRARIIAHLRYDHPVYTHDAMVAQLRHSEISGVNRTSYCGAYWGYGFHEDGVDSALRVGQRFGEAL